MFDVTTPWNTIAPDAWGIEGDIFRWTSGNYVLMMKIMTVNEAAGTATFRLLSFARTSTPYFTITHNLPANAIPGSILNYTFEITNNTPSPTSVRWIFGSQEAIGTGTFGDWIEPEQLESFPPTTIVRNKNCWYEDWATGGVCTIGQTIIPVGFIRISGSLTVQAPAGKRENVTLAVFVLVPNFWKTVSPSSPGGDEYVLSSVGSMIDVSILSDTCAGIICTDICVGNDLYTQVCNPSNGQCIQDALKEANSLTCQSTHYLDIKIKAHSWYTPGGAADRLITKITDINGTLVNLFAGIIDYQYIGVGIFTDAGYVTIRAYLKQLSIAGLAVPLIAQIAGIVTTILYIVIAVGIIVGIYLITKTIESVFGKDYTKSEVGDLLNDILTRAKDVTCKDRFLDDPVGYANCVAAVAEAVGLGGGDFFEDPSITDAGNKAGDVIDACIAKYNSGQLDKAGLEACVSGAIEDLQGDIGEGTCKDGKVWNPITKKCLEECWIPGPLDTCILSAKVGKAILIIGGIGLGIYILTRK